MNERDNPTTLSHATGKLLQEHGWYFNGGWRRLEDARSGSVMPPALSMGEAVDETVARERREMANENWGHDDCSVCEGATQ